MDQRRKNTGGKCKIQTKVLKSFTWIESTHPEVMEVLTPNTSRWFQVWILISLKCNTVPIIRVSQTTILGLKCRCLSNQGNMFLWTTTPNYPNPRRKDPKNKGSQSLWRNDQSNIKFNIFIPNIIKIIMEVLSTASQKLASSLSHENKQYQHNVKLFIKSVEKEV